MAKNVLGRGLGDLLPQGKTRQGGASEDGNQSEEQPSYGPGLRVLVNDRSEIGTKPEERTDLPARPGPRVIQAALICGDCIGLGLVIWASSRLGPNSNGWDIIVKIAAVGCAAWLGVLALMLGFRRIQ